MAAAHKQHCQRLLLYNKNIPSPLGNWQSLYGAKVDRFIKMWKGHSQRSISLIASYCTKLASINLHMFRYINIVLCVIILISVRLPCILQATDDDGQLQKC
jgi:hypothetical protein